MAPCNKRIIGTAVPFYLLLMVRILLNDDVSRLKIKVCSHSIALTQDAFYLNIIQDYQ